jgi:hypothetical protein
MFIQRLHLFPLAPLQQSHLEQMEPHPTFACYPITPTFKCFLFVTPPMPFITSTKTCWYALAFFAFFQIYIYQKHKHNIILVPSSFSTISFVVIDQKRTTISYNKKKNNTTTSFAMGAKQRTTRSITAISKQQVKKKTTMNIIALIVITLGS